MMINHQELVMIDQEDSELGGGAPDFEGREVVHGIEGRLLGQAPLGDEAGPPDRHHHRALLARLGHLDLHHTKPKRSSAHQ
jgi:hypothetical protein